MTAVRFPAGGLWSLTGPAYDYFHAGADLAARIAAGLPFGCLPLPRGPVLYAADYDPARFETRLSEWSHYHGAALAFEVAHVPAPVGAGHTLAHHVAELRPAAVVADSPEPARQLMTGLRAAAMRYGVPIIAASPVALPGVPTLLHCERTAARSGTITLRTGCGDRLIAEYLATCSRDNRGGLPLLAISPPDSGPGKIAAPRHCHRIDAMTARRQKPENGPSARGRNEGNDPTGQHRIACQRPALALPGGGQKSSGFASGAGLGTQN